MHVRIAQSLAAAFCLSFLLLSGSCRHATEPKPIPEPPDTATVKTQVDIAWPGLASSPWPMFGHDPQHTGRSAYPGPQLGQIDWMFNTGASVYPSPMIDQDGTVYIGCDNGNFYAVLPDGNQKWSVQGGSDSSPLIGNDGTIYCYNGSLRAYDRSGALKWMYTIGQVANFASPSISRDGQTIFIAVGSLYAISSGGTLRWKLKPDSTDEVGYALAISPDGSMLYVPGLKALYAIDVGGTLRWKTSRLASNPAVDNGGNIYFGGASVPGSPGDTIYSFTQSGAKRWSIGGIFWGPEFVGPVIGRDGTIYITGKALYAIDHAGHLKWEYPMPFGNASQCVPAIDSTGTLYFGRNTVRAPYDTVNFLALNPDGTLKWQASFKSPDGTVPDIDSPPSIGANGEIYVGSDRPHGLHLYKIR